MKVFEKRKTIIFVVISIALMVLCISLILIHLYNNRFKYEIYESNSEDYQFFNKGYYYEDLGGGVYHYVITLGEKTTNGYSIKIKSVAKEKDIVKVIVSETSPDGVADSVLTYPYVILEIYEKPTKIEIVDTDGNSFERFN